MKYVILIATAAVVLILDQASKAWVSAHMSLHESITVVAGLFNITHIRNPGAAFGFLASAGPLFRSVFFFSITAAAVVLIVYYLHKTKREESLLILSLSLILAGAVSNLIDRIRFGEVIDFFDVYLGTHHWPAFNWADAAISTGAFLLIVQMVRDRRVKEQAT
jgi:signal peptidase II